MHSLLPRDDAVRVSKLRCCHDDATGKVGQRALATPRLAWQHGRSIKPERCDDSHARACRGGWGGGARALGAKTVGKMGVVVAVVYVFLSLCVTEDCS